MSENLKYWVWLSLLTGISPRKCRQLLDRLGHPVNLWELSEKELTELQFLTPNMIRQLVNRNLRAEVTRHLHNLNRYGISVLTIKDKLYPEYLKNIYDPPVVLYTKGAITDNQRIIAVVGSRNASPYGLNTAERLSFELAGCGITVISGMARGVDAYAHKGALKAGGNTIAVLGCGLDIAYPAENAVLMEDIAASGALISEYLPGYPPKPVNFPARNRIISGMSLGVVIVEAHEKSGSLITANYALEQGREVFAVPGNVNSSTSKGTNKLIKDGAKLVTCIEDILEELSCFNLSETGIAGTYKKQNGSACRVSVRFMHECLNEREKVIVDILDNEPMHIDMLAEKSGFCMQDINSMLFMMELNGIIKQLPGKIFEINE